MPSFFLRSMRALGLVLAAAALTLVPVAAAQADPAPYLFVQDSPPARLGAGAAFSYTFSTNDDPSTFSVGQGQLPPGVTLSPAGVLSGAVTESGRYTFSIRASHGAAEITTGASHEVVVEPTLPLRLEAAYGNHQSATVNKQFIGPLGVRVVDDRGYPARDQAVVFTIRPYAPRYTAITFGASSVDAETSESGGYAWSRVPIAFDVPRTATVDVTLATGPGSTTFELTVLPVVVPSADLGVRLSVPARARTRHRVGVEVRVDNGGPSGADQVVTVLTWPRGWSVLDPGTGTVSGRTLTFRADPVDPDLPLTYAVTLTSSTHRGSATLRATTTAATADPSTGNNTDRAVITLRRQPGRP